MHFHTGGAFPLYYLLRCGQQPKERTSMNHITSLLLMGSESTVHENTLVELKKKKVEVLPHLIQMMNENAEPFLQDR